MEASLQSHAPPRPRRTPPVEPPTAGAVLMATELEPRLRAALEGACARVGAAIVPLDLRAVPPAPRLIVGKVGLGGVGIPVEARALAERSKAPMLLVCDEALVGPAISLHGGRSLLLGHPVAPARLAGVARMLLAPGGREVLGPAAWAAAAARDGAHGDRVHRLGDGSMLALAGDHDLPPADLVAALRAPDPDAGFTGRRESRLGGGGAILLDAPARRLVVDWPAGGRELYLYSARRKPSVFRLAGRAGDRSHLTFRPLPGDMLVSVTGSGGASLGPALNHGAAAFLTDLENKAARGVVGASAVLLLEVR